MIIETSNYFNSILILINKLEQYVVKSFRCQITFSVIISKTYIFLKNQYLLMVMKNV